MRVPHILTACLAAAPLLAGCGLSDPSQNVTETFSASLGPGGANTHSFSSAKTGEFSVRLTALKPSTNVALGVGFGQPISGQCIVSTANAFSTLNRDALSGSVNKASYCIIVYDSGAVTTTTSYTITVSHP